MLIDLAALESRADSILAPPPPRVRRSFPALSSCPTCYWQLWSYAGQKGPVQYRRCDLCAARYKVHAL